MVVAEKQTAQIGESRLGNSTEIDTVRQEAALGHKQELVRNFGLWSVTSLGIVIANSWAATGGTIVTALMNGGPMALLYGLILVSIFYTAISASLAELASSMPSAGGVYYWSTVLSGKHGRAAGFFTGYLNACAWLLSASSMSSMLGNEAVAMYLLRHSDVSWHSWQVFIVFQIVNWTCCAIVCLGNRFIPLINQAALILSMTGLFATVVVLAAMPKTHASSSQVWTQYYNMTGGWSDGVCFITGLLNAAFAVGVPDCISHLSEEVPKPHVKVPQGIMIQMLTAFTTSFVYLIALFYSIQDIDMVFNTNVGYFPTAEIYRQATGSTTGAIGLIAVLFLATFPTLIGTFVTGGRMWWSLARDNATPFSSYFAEVHPTLNAPVRATVAMSALVTCIGCIYVGSTTAFQALISSFIVMSTLSYFGAILPHVLTGRRNIVPGPFYMGKTLGMVVNIVSLVYIIVTVIFFCFPFVMPATVQNMNYTSVITVGLMALTALWWFVRGKTEYRGPHFSFEAAKQLTSVRAGEKSDAPAIALMQESTAATLDDHGRMG
ncbi:Amino acid/polyamine transporter I [Penicillium expansum]|uniref:Amino acid/polyamine transporter I n=1 Tax=Penicillium expansum TaxID=27334 RepID=A0A0A2JR71_PENEN|nr:Amino acid/polyamine transporter I [Penicillium expansum]KGO40238.1 Amino acid/polyamine transporter I [Penicillium expansum]KGO45793.1 Amino acid/polyamine transporter I [Penicillium expansum]KGO57937.1 Amino acid/polyamine transporter I [Penicillium expansum]